MRNFLHTGLIDAFGIDEIQYAPDYKYLTVANQIELGITRAYVGGQEGMIESFRDSSRLTKDDLVPKIAFACSSTTIRIARFQRCPH
jgi:hypothetical protein